MGLFSKRQTDEAWLTEIKPPYDSAVTPMMELNGALDSGSFEEQYLAIQHILDYFPLIEKSVKQIRNPSSHEAQEAHQQFRSALKNYINGARQGAKLFKDMAGGAGQRAAYETGYFQRAAAGRLAFNESLFSELVQSGRNKMEQVSRYLDDSPDEEQPSGSSVDVHLESLSSAVFGAALEASKLINEQWTKVTDDQEMPMVSDWAVRVEALGFFLHVVNRLTFMARGEEVRAYIQDYLTIQLVNSLVDNSFDASNVNEGVNQGERIGKIKMEALDVINDSDMDYAKCATMFKPPEVDTTGDSPILIPNENDIMGRFVRRVAEDTGQANNRELLQMAGMATTSVLEQFQIIKQLEITIQTIGK